ncbi:AraC family transcriptional regulator [Paracoccus cavernae]|uniref:AraC family transcriptional regulator n=1 Tax=Paracoccus cavernae TaxID=1571207 RepID=A0ABT8D8B2_9RHOB|nr:AraC family transcriptional regulator [Paracoccus cavernae]
MRLLTEHIEAHLDQPIHLRDLARLAGLSEFHLQRSFRATAGISPHRWILHRRIERAKSRIRAGRPCSRSRWIAVSTATATSAAPSNRRPARRPANTAACRHDARTDSQPDGPPTALKHGQGQATQGLGPKRLMTSRGSGLALVARLLRRDVIERTALRFSG